jgi:hypothetical protein
MSKQELFESGSNEPVCLTTTLIVETANGVFRSLARLEDKHQGRVRLIKRLVEHAELAFGVWQDPTEPEGVGMLVVKGREVLERMQICPDGSRRVRWTAIPCIEAEQAVALRDFIGDIIIH